MGTNLTLRGSIYWWRRRVTVGGHSIALAISLCKGGFNQARARANLLSAAVENLRMAYGEVSDGIDPVTLKAIFTSELKLELDRIEREQIGSGIPGRVYLWANQSVAEVCRILARQDPRFTPEDDLRLMADGWSAEDRKFISDYCHNRAVADGFSEAIDHYERRYDLSPTESNRKRVERIVLEARAAACSEAVKRLQAHPTGMSSWADDALRLVTSPPNGAIVPVDGGGSPNPVSQPERSAEVVPSAAVHETKIVASSRLKKSLREATEECIEAHAVADAWSVDTVEQVHAAMRLFAHACGGDVAIEDLTQEHVDGFYKLCHAMPNRWGKTKDELKRGIPASLDYAEKLKASGESKRIGLSPATIGKHITWIETVLGYADDEGSVVGHRPSTALRFKTKRHMIGTKAESKKVRSRDLRANWTHKEIGRLLEAPIWYGCASLDERFREGREVFHDAWYWLPLMYILYGGRSSELAGLPVNDVFETHEIPYFKVDYSDLRGLKNVQSVRRLPIHPELIRLGFVEFVGAMRELGHELLFPEMHSPSMTFASTFYRAVFKHLRAWAFPEGTDWRHADRGQTKDKDVHSFRGVASSRMKGKIEDSVRFDILGHEGENTTQSVYDEEAALEEKLKGLVLMSPLTAHLPKHALRLRPADRQKFGARRGRPKK